MRSTFLVAALIVATTVLDGQTAADAQPSFEVASIKPSGPGERFDLRPEPGGRFTARSATLKLLISLAYDTKDYQVSDGPGWADSSRFDIVATAGRDISRDELRAMIKTLLADRFKLKLREETKKMSVYSLTIAKSGPKLQEASPDTLRAGVRYSGTHMAGAPATMAQLAKALENALGRPVIDNTGLSGKYNFTLEWSRDKPARPPGDGDDTFDVPSGPSLFTSLQEQLGLRLQAQKGSGMFIVIEHVELPSKN